MIFPLKSWKEGKRCSIGYIILALLHECLWCGERGGKCLGKSQSIYRNSKISEVSRREKNMPKTLSSPRLPFLLSVLSPLCPRSESREPGGRFHFRDMQINRRPLGGRGWDGKRPCLVPAFQCLRYRERLEEALCAFSPIFFTTTLIDMGHSISN